MVRAAAAGVGNAVVLMGASTGRDGIGGASVLASAELGEGDEAKRPTVQIGDPFEESKVLECCLELLEKGLLVSLQDLGAAGLTSSAGEMASAGGVGIDLDVAAGAAARGRHGALRDHGLRVAGADARRGRAGQGRRGDRRLREMADRLGRDRHRHRQRPDAHPARRRCRRRDAGRGAGRRLPALRPRARPSRQGWIYGNRATLASDASAEETLLALLAAPSVASKRWAFEQYDSVVGSRTVRRPESADAAVLQIPEAGNAIAVSIDGNGRRVACDPYAGTIEAVLECAQNLACVGAEPLGLTNCLNFGNPEKPAPAWQLDRSVSGLAEACAALGVPVVGGNVSLYNEGPEGPIYPTPVVGMVGELPDPARACGSAFAPRGRRDRPARPLRTHPGRLGAGQAARRARHRPPPARHRRGRRRLRDRPRRRPRRQARLGPRHQRRRPRLRPGRVRDRRRPRLPRRPPAPARTRLLARGGPVRRGPRRLPAQRRARDPRSARRRSSLGEVGGTTIEIAAGDRSLTVGLRRRRERLALAGGAGRARRLTRAREIFPVGSPIFSRLKSLYFPG